MSAQREPGLRQSAECFTAKAKRPPHMTLDKSDPKRQRMTRAQPAKDIAIKPIIATCVDTRAAVAVDGMHPAPAVLDAAIRTQQCEILPAASPSAPTEQIPSQPYSRLLRLPSHILDRILCNDLWLIDHINLSHTCVAIRQFYTDEVLVSLIAQQYSHIIPTIIGNRPLHIALQMTRRAIASRRMASFPQAMFGITGIGDILPPVDDRCAPPATIAKVHKQRYVAAKCIANDRITTPYAWPGFGLRASHLVGLVKRWDDSFGRHSYSHSHVRNCAFSLRGGPAGHEAFMREHNKTLTAAWMIKQDAAGMKQRQDEALSNITPAVLRALRADMFDDKLAAHLSWYGRLAPAPGSHEAPNSVRHRGQ